MMQAEPEPTISTEHGPWVESNHPGEEGETYCKRCGLRDKFLGKRQCDPHIVYSDKAAIEQASQPEPYDQQALELCDTCGWKTLIPGDGCLNCGRKTQSSNESAYQRGYMDGRAVQSAKPLTDEQVDKLLNEYFYKGMEPTARHYRAFARAIETAHGVKE